MAGRTQAQLKALLGRDLRLDYALSGGFFEDADLASARSKNAPRGERDLTTTDSVDNLSQAVANRLKTRKGELKALGHPEYGSRHHELIGQPNVERVRNRIKLYVLQALRREPRIERVLKAEVTAEHSPPRDAIRIKLTLQLIETPLPVQLIVPFSLEASL